MSDTTEIPDECCGGRCRHCDYWRTPDPQHEAKCGAGLIASLAGPGPEDESPEIGQCDRCGAQDVGIDSYSRCVACGGFTEQG